MLNYYPQPSSQAVLFTTVSTTSTTSSYPPPPIESYYPQTPQQSSNLTTHIKATINAQIPSYEYLFNSSEKFNLLVSILRYDVARYANFTCSLGCAQHWLHLGGGGIWDWESKPNNGPLCSGVLSFRTDLNQSELSNSRSKLKFGESESFHLSDQLQLAHNYSVRSYGSLGQLGGFHRDIENLTYPQVVNKWASEMRTVEQYQTSKGCYVGIPTQFTYERKVEFAVSILYAFNQEVQVAWNLEHITLAGYLEPYCKGENTPPALPYLLGALIHARITKSKPKQYQTLLALAHYINSVCPPSSPATKFVYASMNHGDYRLPSPESLEDDIMILENLEPYMTKMVSPSSGIVLRYNDPYVDSQKHWFISYGNVLKWLEKDFLNGGDSSTLVTRKILFYMAVILADPEYYEDSEFDNFKGGDSAPKYMGTSITMLADSEFHDKGGKSSRKYIVAATIPKVTPRTIETPKKFLQKPMDTTTPLYETSHKDLVDLCEQNWLGIYQQALTWEQFHQCELTTPGSWILGLIMITLLCLIISLALMLICVCLRRNFYPSSIELKMKKKQQQQTELVVKEFPEKDSGEVNEFYI